MVMLMTVLMLLAILNLVEVWQLRSGRSVTEMIKEKISHEESIA